MPEETDEEFEAFLAGVDRALTEHFGPNHQEVLAGDPASYVRSFHWGELPMPPYRYQDEDLRGGSALSTSKRIDPG